MKKKSLTSLSLNKKSISKLNTNENIVGGARTISCVPLGICCPTHDAACPTTAPGCGGTGNDTADCETNQHGCTVPTNSVFLC